MSVARLARERKRQLGQFLTPPETARAIVGGLDLSVHTRILEPSFGTGAFLLALLDRLGPEIEADSLSRWSATHLFGCEIDPVAYGQCAQEWRARGWGNMPASLENTDFFTWLPPACDRRAATDRKGYFASPLEFFDIVIGNPPFGGSIAPAIQDELDDLFGMRAGRKIKKETYAFFIVKCVDLLKPGGRLVFICSDTLLTIPTMTGLRNWLQRHCDIDVTSVPGAFADTNQDMILLTLRKRRSRPQALSVLGSVRPLSEVEATPNLSWQVNGELARYFTGVSLGDKMVATSGMTIGNNDLFLRAIEDGRVLEPYEFYFGEEPITLAKERERARLGKLSRARVEAVRALEAKGATEKSVVWKPLAAALRIALPHEDYAYYNKATSDIIFSQPRWAIFWRDAGDYVYTYKKTGNWYLHGVGGKPYFGREGITWSLIAPRMYTRYLPAGYILDSGAPCAFLRAGVHEDELYFILGWTLTDLCTRILKTVLNHTRNIQSKDFERLPYPVWVNRTTKDEAIRHVKTLIEKARRGGSFSFKNQELQRLNELYAWNDRNESRVFQSAKEREQLSLLS